MKLEISRPHYHPGPDFDMTVTKKRDLSVPPHWVANERIENPETGESFAIVMPPRDKELYEVRQPVHIHMPEYVELTIKGQQYLAKVKLSEGSFKPVIHMDHIEAKELGVSGGDICL